MKKYILGLFPTRETVLKGLVVVLVLGSLVLVEVITYRETVDWVSQEATHYYNGKMNNDFFAQSR